jgi:hypothetical protein
MSQGERFWADAVTEPKRKYRFLLTNMRGIPQWVIKTVKKPSLQITESEHSFINYKFYYPGRVEWQPIDITLIDPVDPDATATLMEMVRDMGYVYPSDVDQGSIITISKEKAIKALGDVIYIEQIDADTGGKIESWELKNPFITNLDFGDLSYEDDGIVEISMTLRYDWARCVLQNKDGVNFVNAPGDRIANDVAAGQTIPGSGRT